MAEYYLISQLPSLDGVAENTPLPIDEERFLELCNKFLSKTAQKELSELTLLPSKTYKKSSSALVEKWYDGERNLRIALAIARAEKMKKSFETEKKTFSIELIKAVNFAVEMENPLEAENFLNRYRMDFLESLRPMDNFSLDFVFYYALKLKLILRIRQFDTNAGEAAYRNIYNSILDGDRLEAI